MQLPARILQVSPPKNRYPANYLLLGKLDHIPTVGSPGLLGSYWSAVKYISNAIDIVQQGFNKVESTASSCAAN